MNWDVDFYMRDEATRLVFAAPSDSQTLWFPDADGTIITSGNVHQISHLRGLEGSNSFIFASGTQPGDATTIIDFAALGTAPPTRKRGRLPQYLGPDGHLAHTEPEKGGVRIVFPDATGTVITTGNTDDLIFKSINLEGLEVQLEANFGEAGSPEVTMLNFGASSRVSGCFNFVNAESDTAYTQMCAIPPTGNNRMELPDVSGVVLTTGNLLGLPSISIPDEHLFVGGHVSVQGSIELGHANNMTTIEMFTWIDGDVGLTLQSAGGQVDGTASPGSASAGTWRTSRTLSTSSLDVSVPHMSGLDRAMRSYLRHAVKDLPVDVQHVSAYRSPVAGSSRINQSFCSALLTEEQVPNYHALGYYLTAHTVLLPTLLRGRPYAGVLDINGSEHVLAMTGAGTGGNATFSISTTWLPWASTACGGPEGVHDCSEERFVCAGSAPGQGATYQSGHRNGASGAGMRGSGAQSPSGDSRCVFDGDVSTSFASSHVSSVPLTVVASQDMAVSGHLNALVKLPSTTHMLTGRCVVGMMFSTPRLVSRFRIYARKGYALHVEGARLEGLRDGVWEQLFVFEAALREGEWNDVDLAHLSKPAHPSQQDSARNKANTMHDVPLSQHTLAGTAFFKAFLQVRFAGLSPPPPHLSLTRCPPPSLAVARVGIEDEP